MGMQIMIHLDVKHVDQKSIAKDLKDSDLEMDVSNLKYNKSLTYFHVNRLHYVRFKVCLKFPEIVNSFRYIKKHHQSLQ